MSINCAHTFYNTSRLSTSSLNGQLGEKKRIKKAKLYKQKIIWNSNLLGDEYQTTWNSVANKIAETWDKHNFGHRQRVMSTLSPASTYKSSLMELFQRSEAHEENPQTGKVVKIVRNISIILLFMLVFGLIVWILWQLSNQQNKIHEFDVKLTEYQNISERMTNKNKEFADDIRYGYSLNFFYFKFSFINYR